MTPLYRMMHEWARTPFVWGQSDCCLVVADWYQALWGVDPAAHLRGTYHDALTCRKTGWFANPVKVVDDVLAPCERGVEIDTPTPGSVAVIQVARAGGNYCVGAIWLGTVWGVKGPDGVTTLHPRQTFMRKAWDIGYDPQS